MADTRTLSLVLCNMTIGNELFEQGM